jgi:hypothetical protein
MADLRLDPGLQRSALTRLQSASRAGASSSTGSPARPGRAGPAASVNRKLAALNSFCQLHARDGVGLGGLLAVARPPGRGLAGTAFRPFLHHVIKGTRRGLPGRSGLPVAGRFPGCSPLAAQAVLDACEHLRDRLLLVFCSTPGCSRGRSLWPAPRGHGHRRMPGERGAAGERERGAGQGRRAARHPGERCVDARNRDRHLPTVTDGPRARRRWRRHLPRSTPWCW